jgi:hypothetical protein
VSLGRLKVGGTLCVHPDTGVGLLRFGKGKEKRRLLCLKFSDLGINSDR